MGDPPTVKVTPTQGRWLSQSEGCAYPVRVVLSQCGVLTQCWWYSHSVGCLTSDGGTPIVCVEGCLLSEGGAFTLRVVVTQ